MDSESLLGDANPERALIGCLLLDGRAIRAAAEVVVPADFNDMRLGSIFEGILAMRREQVAVDVFTVSDRLSQWEAKDISAADLHAWMSLPSSWVAATDYADIVRRESMRRAIRAASTRLEHGAKTNDLATVVHLGINELRDLIDTHAVRKLEAVKLKTILEGSVDYEWVIEGLLEKRDRVLVTGVEGGGKSTLMRQIAVASAAGVHPFTFDPIPPTRVLVVDAENSEVQWRRQVQRIVNAGRSFGSVDPTETVMIRCTSRLDLTREQDLGQVQAMVERHRPDILFIGPLYRLVPRAINSDDDAAPLLAALDTLRESGAALVMEAHAGHAIGHGGTRDLRPRGSSALLGWPEFGFGLQPVREGDGRASDEVDLVRWRGDRDARSWPRTLMRGQSWPWAVPDGGWL